VCKNQFEKIKSVTDCSQVLLNIVARKKETLEFGKQVKKDMYVYVLIHIYACVYEYT
jgi:hypothetical protein